MKKLLILPAVALVAASGCQSGRFTFCQRPVVETMDCAPACDTCSEGGMISGGETIMSAPPAMMVPGPIVQ